MNQGITNILLANHHLQNPGGSETYTYTIAEELTKRNVNIEYFTFYRGGISERMEKKLGIQFMTRKRYDLILANHNTCVDYLFNRGFVIQTCHGIFPDLEQPSAHADAHVAISQEVKDHLSKLGYISEIILNGINTDRYSIKTPIHISLQTVLSLCHSGHAHTMIKEACDMLGCSLIVQDKYQNPVWEVEQLINRADLVVGVGRSAYEAMSCGRPVIIFDHREYYPSCGDGYVKDILEKSLLKNCSGRFSNRSYDARDMAIELSKYRQADSAFFRNFALQNLNIVHSVDQYLEYYYKNKKNVFSPGIALLRRKWKNKRLRKKIEKQHLHR